MTGMPLSATNSSRKQVAVSRGMHVRHDVIQCHPQPHLLCVQQAVQQRHDARVGRDRRIKAGSQCHARRWQP